MFQFQQSSIFRFYSLKYYTVVSYMAIDVRRYLYDISEEVFSFALRRKEMLFKSTYLLLLLSLSI
jgi:hypothetical protein